MFGTMMKQTSTSMVAPPLSYVIIHRVRTHSRHADANILYIRVIYYYNIIAL